MNVNNELMAKNRVRQEVFESSSSCCRRVAKRHRRRDLQEIAHWQAIKTHLVKVIDRSVKWSICKSL